MHKDLKTELTTPLTNLLGVSNLKLPLLLMSLLILTACGARAPETEVVLQTEYQKQNIPIQERPKAVQFPPVDWFVITEENLEEKIAEIDTKTGNVVVFAITPKGYENLALGIAELRRYVKDQQAIIAYYEEALTEPETPKKEEPTE
jgi:hypothetical protein